jgi:hypothetical protein
MALGPGDSETPLWAMSAANFASSRELQENLTSLNIRGVIWDMADISEDVLFKFPAEPQVPRVRPLILARQHINSILKYNVLTSEGIYTLVQNTPLEIFRHIITQFGSESKPLQLFSRLHGNLEICVMSLMIICSDSKADASIRTNAVRIFFTFGGEPQSVYRNPHENPRNMHGNVLEYSPMNASIADITSFRCNKNTGCLKKPAISLFFWQKNRILLKNFFGKLYPKMTKWRFFETLCTF